MTECNPGYFTYCQILAYWMSLQLQVHLLSGNHCLNVMSPVSEPVFIGAANSAVCYHPWFSIEKLATLVDDYQTWNFEVDFRLDTCTDFSLNTCANFFFRAVFSQVTLPLRVWRHLVSLFSCLNHGHSSVTGARNTLPAVSKIYILVIEGRDNFFLQSQLCVLTVIQCLFHPHVTTVARKRPRSYFQKCRWQVTPKHAHTLDPMKLE